MSIGARILLEKAASGSEEKRRELWEYWKPRLSLFLRSNTTLSEEDREDLLQDVMEKIFVSLGKYNPLYAPSTWIYTIARRVIIDRRRRENWIHRENLVVKENWENIPGIFDSPEKELIRQDDLLRIRRFIETRSENDREILFLTCYEEMSGRAAAKILEIPASTVRDRIKHLKKELEVIWHEEER